MHTCAKEPQALAVNTQASHKMLCKYLQLGRRWKEKNVAAQACRTWSVSSSSPHPITGLQVHWANNLTFSVSALRLTLAYTAAAGEATSAERGAGRCFLKIKMTILFWASHSKKGSGALKANVSCDLSVVIVSWMSRNTHKKRFHCQTFVLLSEVCDSVSLHKILNLGK